MFMKFRYGLAEFKKHQMKMVFTCFMMVTTVRDDESYVYCK